MTHAPIRGAVFDADGTLFDTERLAREVWLTMAREWGADAIAAHYKELIGRNREGIVSLLRPVCPPGFPLDDFLRTCSLRTRERMTQGVPVKEGARELLEFLNSCGLPLAMATSSGGPTTRFKLESSGLAPCFQAVITGDMVAQGKPHPEIYLTACRALGLEPSQVLAVEDSPNGIRSAHAAGTMVVMIPDLIPPTPELDRLVCCRCGSLTELRERLEQMLTP